MPRRLLALFVLAATACSNGPADPDQAHRTKADTADFTPPEGALGESPIDRGEDPDGAALENMQFDEFAAEIQAIQERLRPILNLGTTRRGFHAKGHACVQGELRVLPDRAAATKFGIFQETDNEQRTGRAQVFPVYARFSNGLGFRGPDQTPDVRGLAIKILGVSSFGDKLREDETVSDTQDILSTNSPAQLADDAAGFMEFGRTQGDPIALGKWGLLHPDAALTLTRRTGRFVPSLLAEQFWTGGANRLGPRAVRFTFVPCGDVDVDLDIIKHLAGQFVDGEDSVFSYLRADLKAHASRGDLCYDLGVLWQTDAESTPIESAATEWNSPVSWVAQLVIPQQEFDINAESGCEDLAFTPWHSLEQHRPLGNINRVRKAVYDASASHRNGDQGPHGEPVR